MGGHIMSERPCNASRASALRSSAESPEATTMSAFSELTQVSLITPDADQTIVKLRAALAAGSFKVVTMDAPALFNRSYDGQPEPWSMRLGISWIGTMQIEVI